MKQQAPTILAEVADDPNITATEMSRWLNILEPKSEQDVKLICFDYVLERFLDGERARRKAP